MVRYEYDKEKDTCNEKEMAELSRIHYEAQKV